MKGHLGPDMRLDKFPFYHVSGLLKISEGEIGNAIPIKCQRMGIGLDHMQLEKVSWPKDVAYRLYGPIMITPIDEPIEYVLFTWRSLTNDQ